MRIFGLTTQKSGFEVVRRAIVGTGIVRYLSNRMHPNHRRRAIGLTLLGVGVVSTVQAVRALMRGRKQGIRHPFAVV